MTATSNASQIARPWRATVRTGVQAALALALMLPLLVDAAGLDETAPPVAGALVLAGAFARVMALPAVEGFLRRFVPWLAAEPRPVEGEAYDVDQGDDEGHDYPPAF